MAVIKSGSTTDQLFITAANAAKVDGSGVTQPVSGSISVSNFPATQPISGSVSVSNFPGTQAVTGPLTDTQLRASDVNVKAKESDSQNLIGVYYYSSPAFTVQTAADAATAGRAWLINPVGSAVTVRIKRINFSSQLGSALAAPTSPRLTIERVTFTGTASGAQVAAAKRKSSDASPASLMVTASTGLTLTAGAAIRSFLPAASATAVGYAAATVDTWHEATNDRLELAPGEGLVIRQPDAGTNADTRRITFDLTIEEF